MVVLTATRGEHRPVIPEALRYLEQDPGALAALQDAQAERALALLGVEEHRYLGAPGARAEGRDVRRYTDSGAVAGDRGAPRLPEDLDADALSAADLAEVAADVRAAIQRVHPDVVVLPNAFGGDGDPDAIRVHDAVVTALSAAEGGDWAPSTVFAVERPRRVARRSAVEVDKTGRFEAVPETRRANIPDRRVDAVVDASRFRGAKEAALREYATRFVVASGEVGFADGRAIVLSGVERFSEHGGRAWAARRPARDLCDGWEPVAARDDGALVSLSTGEVVAVRRTWWRTGITAAAALAVGMALGAAAAAGHRATLAAGSWDVPLGFPVTLAALWLGVAAVRLLVPDRLIASCLGIGAIAAILILLLEGPGGSVIFPAQNVVLVDGAASAVENWSGRLWIYAAVFGTVIAVVWPRLRRTRSAVG